MKRTGFFAALATVVTVTCSGPEPVPPDPFAALPVWSYEPRPDLILGSAEGEDVLFHVGDALALNDGRIVVADAGDGSVKYFDADGRFLRRVGRFGDGPGEFRNLAWPVLGTFNDTVVVWDMDLQRATWLGRDGEYVASVDLRSRGHARLPLLAATGRNVVVQVNALRFPRGRYGLVRDTADIIVLDRANREGRLLMQRPGQEYAIVEGPSGGPGAWTESGFKNGLRGSGRGGTFYLGLTDSAVVHRYSLDGKKIGEIRWVARRIPVGDSIMRLQLKSVDTFAASSRMKRDIKERFRRGENTGYLPEFDRVLVDDSGNVWIRRYEYQSESRIRWMVFDSSGIPRARAELPPDTRSIGQGVALARWADENGVMFVHRHRLKRRVSAAEGTSHN